MRGLLKRDTLVGWAFAALGYALIHWHYPAMENLLHARGWAQFFFPHHLALQYFFMGFFTLALIPAAGLCAVTGWGVGHKRHWSRWTGLMPCLYLMAGFPWLTVVGALALWFLWTQRVERRELTGAEFWSPRRQSGWMLTASILGWLVARLAFTGLQVRASSMGLPPLDPGGPGVLALVLLMWGHVALHECGHALAAVAAGHRVKVLAIGPLVFSKNSGGYRVRFDWRHLLLLDGYMGAVPASPRGFRERQMAVVAAGPLTSLAAGAVLLAVFLLVPRTPLAGLWQWVAMGSVAGFYIGAINLLPLGYCDGTILFHLLFRTRRGAELTNLILHGTAGNAPGQAACDYEDEVARRSQAIQQLLDIEAPDRLQLGERYIALGSMEVAAQRRRDAERHVVQGLEMLPEDAALSSQCVGWECLQILRTARHDRAGATDAYEKGLAAAERIRTGAADPRERLHATLAIAGKHVRAQAWVLGLRETAAALEDCPADEAHRMCKGMLLRLRAQALLETGSADAGLEAAAAAAEIFRAQPAGLEGPHRLGSLGEVMWNAGRTDDAVALLTESIRLLETRGGIQVGAAFRLFLAEVLRAAGRPAAAACVLPQSEVVNASLRAIYHEQRGAVRRSGGKLPAAIADLSTAVAIYEAEEPVDQLTLAEARARLAEAMAQSGDMAGATPLAEQARETLAAAGHPACARACITLAVVGSRQAGSPGDFVDAALACWDAAPFLFPAGKAREREEAAAWLEASGLPVEASRCRSAGLAPALHAEACAAG